MNNIKNTIVGLCMDKQAGQMAEEVLHQLILQ
jgi:hypothetical protein